MTLYPLNVGNFKLDGGAMFGVVPKSIWNKSNPADQNNMIDMAARCLLIEDGRRLILIDTGMGNKQSSKFFNYYYRWGEQGVEPALAKHGFHKDDITDVFLTHLHFDHCGGGVERNLKNERLKLTLTLKEKDALLNLAAKHNYYLFLEHDSQHELITVKHTEKGVRLNKTYLIKSIL